ncbi:hypothetical protein [Saccharopolyspora rosea]|uniref:Uncharacterized protein n=1 Tax=Saccharopolyspora rosea TaxID=524884 RepID=A0ABW3FWY2_9PSEU|nr:hypothetical protein [Saccharopolyspora rosea]
MVYRAHGVETATVVGLSESVRVTHEYDKAFDEVILTFRGNDELVLSCTRRGFVALRDAVAAVEREWPGTA